MSGAKRAATFMLISALAAVLLAGGADWAHAELVNVRSYVALDPSHIATDSLGRIITLDIIDSTLSILTPSTGTTQLIKLGFVPSTLAVGGTGPNERIYVGYRNDDRIAVYNLDVTSDGHIQFQGSNVLHPQEHAVDSTGLSFVFLDDFTTIKTYNSLRAYSDSITEYPHNGDNIPLRTNILAAAPDGDFVMTAKINGHVVVFSYDVQAREFVTKFVISKTRPGTALDNPTGLAINPDGLIFVHDSNGIHVFNPDGTYVKTHQSPPLTQIIYMDFLGHNLLISDKQNDRVRCYAVDGVDDGSCPSPPQLEEEHRYPVGASTQQLAVDSSGRIITLNRAAPNEQLFFTDRSTSAIQGHVLPYQTSSLATNPDGRIYVGSTDNSLIYKYHSNGGIFDPPFFIDDGTLSLEHAISSDGTHFVLTEEPFSRLYAYSGDEMELGVIAQYTNSQTGSPSILHGSYLAISPDAAFAVVASEQDDIVIVYEYDPAANPVFTEKFVISETSPGTDLANPRTPAVSPDGLIFVRDDNGIHVFSSEDGSYVKFYVDPLSDSSDMAFLGENLLLTHIPSGGPFSVVSYSVGGVDEGDKSSAGQQSSASKDYMHTPTFGLSLIDYSQIVSCGYSMDGICRDVLDYHVDYKRAEIATNSAHDFTLKSYAPMGLRQFQIVFGLPSIGTPLSEGEATISINLARDYTVDSTYVIESISYQNENNVIDQDATISLSEAKCRDSDVEMSCTEVAINDVLFREQMYHEPFAITATDTHGRTITHYLNEGLLVKGESLNEAPVSHGGILKKGNQHDAIPIQLVRIDKLNDLWEDQWGNIWTKNDYSTWKKLTIEEFERNDDNTWSVMTRINSNFYKMIESEADKATLVWDGKSIQNDVEESFSFAPMDRSESRLEKLADQIGIEQDRAQKIMDKLIQRSMPIISENVDSMPQQAKLSHSEGMLKVVGRVAITPDTDLELTYGNPDRSMTVQIPVNDDGTFEYSVLMDKAPTVSLHYNKALLAWMS